ncbi:MAG TPA: ATP-binding protein [Polyangiales bacterium]|nr:ATP-binding protein [Polyangiales bacterium]
MDQQATSFSITKLRNLILVALVVGVALYTGVMFSLAQRLSERFGPQVASDLEWRVQRGAQELARAADLGIAINDQALVQSAFGVYATSKDVQAIVAVDTQGNLIATHGKPPNANLFAGKPGVLVRGDGYLLSWAEAQIEGSPVGKVAVVVTTLRMREAQELLDRSSNTTLTGGLGALLLGTLVVTFFTGAVALRDAQLSDYAKNLEQKVDERTRELDERNRGMRLVLDNVAQGFITIDLHGSMASERSAIVDRWFGAPPAKLTSYLASFAPKFVEQLELGLSELRDGIMPVELLLYQLPARFSANERTFEATYSPIGNPEAPDRLLVILSDVTAAVARERAEQEQRELIALFQRIANDRTGVEEFLVEAAHLVGALRDEQDPVVQQRLVHTLKGNCAMYGLSSYAELAHQVENELIEHQKSLDATQRAALVEAWKRTIGRVGWLLGGNRKSLVQLDAAEIDALIARAQAGAVSREIVASLTDWKREPVHRRLERLARQSTAVAERLNKQMPKIEIEDHGIRLDGEGLTPFWTAMVHVVRNALDHGIEDAETRALAGKPPAGTIGLSTRRQDGKLVIAVRDDGRGVDWEKLRSRARERGLPHDTRHDLIEAMFADGISTRDVATDVSGRGVGMAALRQVVHELGGTIEVESAPAQGTVFRFVFDERRVSNAPLLQLRRPRASLMPSFS